MEPLAFLEGRPIHLGDILYGLDGARLKASTTSHRDYSLAMIDLATVHGNTWSQWLTNTHWKGQQVLFWSLDDIPKPQDRTLYCRLSEQLEAKRATEDARRKGQKMLRRR